MKLKTDILSLANSNHTEPKVYQSIDPKQSSKVSKPTAKQPLNSFMLFKKLNYAEIQRLVIHKSNDQNNSKFLGAEISKEAGIIWKSLAPEHRQAFTVAAKKSMAEYKSKKESINFGLNTNLGCIDTNFQSCWTPVASSMFDAIWN
jgi:hypothetical protein